jgi:hypothetical protein
LEDSDNFVSHIFWLHAPVPQACKGRAEPDTQKEEKTNRGKQGTVTADMGGGLEPNKTTAKEQETSSSAIIPFTVQ